jgi:hypothetical protein
MLQFGKSECLVSSRLAAVKRTVDSSEGVLPPTKWRMRKNKNHDEPKGLWRRLLDFIARKNEK